MSATATALLQGFSRLEATRNGHDSAWVKGLRRAAFEWVSARGFPTAKDDAWRYTQVRPILEVPFRSAEPGMGRGLSLGAIDELAGALGGTRLVFVNGYFVPGLSSHQKLPDGARVTNLASALAGDGGALQPFFSRPFRDQTHAFTALNAACGVDGAFVQIPANTEINEPIHLVFVSDAGAEPLVSHPRSVVFAGAGSRATIVETYAGVPGGVYFTNAVTEVVLDEGSTVEHYKVQNEQQTAFHVGLLDVRQERSSRCTAHSVALGSSIARHEVNVKLEGAGAQTTLNGLYLPQNEQLLDNPTTIEHAAPRCTSSQLYKGVVDGKGHGVFDGRIVVAAGADKTDASQTNKNLLLSASAQIDTRPRLEIFADDVKCAHGATVGQLDEEAVFYLRSRGIALNAARGLLTYAFVSQMLELIRVAPLRSSLEKQIAARLSAAGVGIAR